MEPDKQGSPSIIERFAAHSVCVNGLIVPGRSIESYLARYSLNLIVNNPDEIFKVLLVGSATPVLHRGRYILLTTQHQLNGVDPRQIAMLTDSGSHIITSGGLRLYSTRSDTDAYDIVAFDFTEPCNDRPELRRRFFLLRGWPPEVRPEDVQAVLLTGYPAADQNYDIFDNNHLGLVRRNVVCKHDSQPSDSCIFTVKALRPLGKSPNGMSGGSAFVIQLEVDQFNAYLSGIILRGGTDYFHVLKISSIIAFLDSVFVLKP